MVCRRFLIYRDETTLFFHGITTGRHFTALKHEQNGRDSADDICKCIFSIQNIRFLKQISMNFNPKGCIEKLSAN